MIETVFVHVVCRDVVQVVVIIHNLHDRGQVGESGTVDSIPGQICENNVFVAVESCVLRMGKSGRPAGLQPQPVLLKCLTVGNTSQQFTKVNLCCVSPCLAKRLVKLNNSLEEVETLWRRSVGTLSCVNRLTTNRGKLGRVATEDDVDATKRAVCTGGEYFPELTVK